MRLRPLTSLLADAVPIGEPSAVLLNYGAIGVAALLLGYFAWTAIKRERDRADRLEKALQQANDRLIAANERIAETVSVVLVETRNALSETNDYLRALRRGERP